MAKSSEEKKDSEMAKGEAAPKAVLDIQALDQYASSFGLDLAELDAHAIDVLMAAERVESYFKDLDFKLPAKYREGEQVTRIPSEKMEVNVIKGPEEIPDILPTEWAMEEEAPELFYKKLQERQLLKREWREPTKEVEPTPEEEKPFAYALLDVSGSMIEEDPKRSVIGKALVLAFLKRGIKRNAQLGFRAFESDVHPRQTGSTKRELSDIARKILDQGIGGGTNIHRALVQGADDMKELAKTPRGDVLLVTDGLSYLGANPLGEVKLHTFLLGNTNFDPQLQDWSATFRRIDDDKLAELTSAEQSREAAEIVERESEAIPDQASRVLNRKDAEQLIRKVKILRNVTDTMCRKMYDVKHEGEDWREYNKKKERAEARADKWRQRVLKKLETFPGVENLLEKNKAKIQDAERLEKSRREKASDDLVKTRAQLGLPGRGGRAVRVGVGGGGGGGMPMPAPDFEKDLPRPLPPTGFNWRRFFHRLFKRKKPYA